MRIPLFHIDAFTRGAFGGNPAAVCLLQSWLDDGTLRKVAAENNLSETAFLVPVGDHFDLRWFTPRGEVKLCGHGTLASAFVVLNFIQAGHQAVRFDTRFSGSLSAIRDGDMIAMDFPAMFPEPCSNPPDGFSRIFGASNPPTDVLEVNQTLYVVYENERIIREMRPNFARLESLHPLTVAVTAPGSEVDFVSRYFKPSYGMLEDPVTGSAHCALTPYWAGRLGKSRLHARQLSARGGELWCTLQGNRVILNGHAVLTLQGTMVLLSAGIY
jgi:predicted PhzF superfamily epimerase YddE/YHI9